MRRRLCVLAAVAAAALGVAGVASAENYIVLYKQQSVGVNAAKAIQQAGGMMLYSYNQIGVAIASSSNASFREKLLLRDTSVENASPTSGFAVRLDETESAEGPPPGDLPNAPATDSDTFSGLQWDMRQINAPEAHAITGGSPTVLVGDLDTGLDFDHPDLVQNIDFANSTSCVGGTPNQLPGAWDDDNGHGTHTAGTIAAAANGIGIVGVAPNVRIAGVKVGDSDGFFFPEAVVCAFVWAGTHHFDVTNNSYFADPWLFNCHNDPGQQAIWKAEARAILFAESQGVTVVAAEGNFSDDLAHPTQDILSPDTEEEPPPRTIHNNCVVIPVEVPGVIGVTATGDLRLKSYYSNYGVGVTEVAAPGGDRRLQVNPADGAVNGRVLSTYPEDRPCTGNDLRLVDPAEPTAVYCYLQGTSMAAPHVTGVAALVISRYGDLKSRQNGKLRPGQVAALIQQTATPTACPDDTTLLLYAPFPSFSNGAPQTCQGGTGYNSWYGKGIVDALAAITHTP